MDVESEDSHNSDLEKSAMNIDEWGIIEQRETFYEDDIVREYGGNFHNDKYNDICLIKYNDIINIFGTQLLLYPTFVDQNEAITNISIKLADFISVLAQESNLCPLSDENWEEYNAAVYSYMSN